MSIAAFTHDYCYIVIDVATGFASIRDIWDGMEIWEADDLDEALIFLAA
ncbi:MAG: hypothetical protein KME42_13820 [Tildeniella nuda ZEHNDER 1965/U140]|jgi:hypothetical protein|nr:hypothetical protein [Tildeniella nuda ZEHNDER 1965/U140]